MKRAFQIEEWHYRETGDGRTVEGRIVPYNQTAIVRERNNRTGELEEYREQFLYGSCAAMCQSAARRGNAGWIMLLIDHEPNDFSAKAGYAKELREEKDGAYATFRLYESRDLDKTVSMLRESHTGLSVNFADRVPPDIRDGVISRRQVHIDHVAATPTPAYAGALITNMREIDIISADTPHLDAVKQWLEESRKIASA